MILGITGTIGAGKGTVVEYLVQEKGFAHFSVRVFLLEEIAARGLTPDRNAFRTVGNDLRAMYGPSYIIETLYARAKAHGGPSLIESVRAIGEAEFLRNNGAKLLAVDADQMTRYSRIAARGLSTDHIDFETFFSQEAKELSSTEANGMNVLAVMQQADYQLMNNGTLLELHADIERMLNKI